MALSSTIVCNNILQRAFSEKISVTPMKLQKLLYFTSCEYIKNTGNALLSEDFCVWKYGPVLPTVYDEFKCFHGNSIDAYAKDANNNALAYNEASAPNLKEAIDKIWNCFKNYTGVGLSRITHEDGSGWSSAFSKKCQFISNEEMRADDSYYRYMQC